MKWLYPLRLEASLHETIWGGRRLEQDHWKRLPRAGVVIGEAWETETSTVVQNGPYRGKTLGEVVVELGEALLGEQALAITGQRFPLLAKFIDANTKLSVQVHPDDTYAASHEHGKLGKTEFWYILSAAPGARIVHGFKAATTRAAVEQAIAEGTLEALLREEEVSVGDIIFVPTGIVHAIGGGILLYELQEYSDITYRLYDYGRLESSGSPRKLHIERALDVAHLGLSPRIKTRPVALPAGAAHQERCLAACNYFVALEITLTQQAGGQGYFKGQTTASCAVITSLGAEALVRYGDNYEQSEPLTRGQTVVLPAALSDYCIEGSGTFVYSYVPQAQDEALRLWQAENGALT